MIDDAGLITFAPRVRRPSLSPVFRRRTDEGSRRFEPFAQTDDGLSIRTTGRGIATFEQDE